MLLLKGDGKFQSAPPTGVRGDSGLRCLYHRRRIVSIRSPHRSEGRLLQASRGLPDLVVSIRSPHRSEGRSICFRRQPGHLANVSIRSPHRSEGRFLSPPASRTPASWFQSAPPTGVRGDQGAFAAEQIRSIVSIRSPHRSEGRWVVRHAIGSRYPVSIRSPHRSEGR